MDSGNTAINSLKTTSEAPLLDDKEWKKEHQEVATNELSNLSELKGFVNADFLNSVREEYDKLDDETKKEIDLKETDTEKQLVQKIQGFLIKQGYLTKEGNYKNGELDGVPGTLTRKAFENWKNRHNEMMSTEELIKNLDTNGIQGEYYKKGLTLLNEIAKNPQYMKALGINPDQTTWIEKGGNNGLKSIVDLQKELNKQGKKGSPKLVADGLAGGKTAEAFKKWTIEFRKESIVSIELRLDGKELSKDEMRKLSIDDLEKAIEETIDFYSGKETETFVSTSKKVSELLVQLQIMKTLVRENKSITDPITLEKLAKAGIENMIVMGVEESFNERLDKEFEEKTAYLLLTKEDKDFLDSIEDPAKKEEVFGEIKKKYGFMKSLDFSSEESLGVSMKNFNEFLNTSKIPNGSKERMQSIFKEYAIEKLKISTPNYVEAIVVMSLSTEEVSDEEWNAELAKVILENGTKFLKNLIGVKKLAQMIKSFFGGIKDVLFGVNVETRLGNLGVPEKESEDITDMMEGTGLEMKSSRIKKEGLFVSIGTDVSSIGGRKFPAEVRLQKENGRWMYRLYDKNVDRNGKGRGFKDLNELKQAMNFATFNEIMDRKVRRSGESKDMDDELSDKMLDGFVNNFHSVCLSDSRDPRKIFEEISQNLLVEAQEQGKSFGSYVRQEIRNGNLLGAERVRNYVRSVVDNDKETVTKLDKVV